MTGEIINYPMFEVKNLEVDERYKDIQKQGLLFTTGPHVCLGQHLARLQVRLTVETLLRRFPTLALAVPANEIAWEKTSFMRGVESLPLRW